MRQYVVRQDTFVAFQIVGKQTLKHIGYAKDARIGLKHEY